MLGLRDHQSPAPDSEVLAQVRERYFDLLKKTLSFSLWPEPPATVNVDAYGHQPLKQRSLRLLTQLLGRWNFQLSKGRTITQEERENGVIWPGYAHTMIGRKRLDNLQLAVETVIRERIPGDLIETGVWRGGACILMRAVLAAYGVPATGISGRRVFVADSFQGLPKPDADRYPADQGDLHHTMSDLAVSAAQVRENFEMFGFGSPGAPDTQVVFLQGWFKDTIPKAPIEKLAVLRLDGDMYESTIQVLEALYPKLSPDGFLIIDDYSIPNCRRAVEDFRNKHGVKTPIETIDFTGRFWRK